jgi:adenine-specific DNA methylase
MVLEGYALAGTSQSRDRVEDDYYATPHVATNMLLEKIELSGSILEPACGEGHISKLLINKYPNSEIISTDLVNRGYGTGGVDFLTNKFNRKFDNIITNPPFKYAREFIERALELSTQKVIIFCKIQLLEGIERKKMFETTPLKTVYVFSKRVNPLRNGSEVDEKGKKWASTMCFAWFVWEKGYEGQPMIKWL